MREYRHLVGMPLTASCVPLEVARRSLSFRQDFFRSNDINPLFLWKNWIS